MSGKPFAFSTVARPGLVDLDKLWSRKGLQLPIVYHPSYNITFWGLEKLHPFDSCKFAKIAAALDRHTLLGESASTWWAEPQWPDDDALLLDVHSAEYLEAVRTSSRKVASVGGHPCTAVVCGHVHINDCRCQVTELGVLALLPSFLTRRKVVRPMEVRQCASSSVEHPPVG